MNQNGWKFYMPVDTNKACPLHLCGSDGKPNGNNVFLSGTSSFSDFCKGVPSTSYCGYTHPGDGTIAFTLHGHGTLVVDFGNSWTSGLTVLDLNGETLGSAGPKELPWEIA